MSLHQPLMRSHCSLGPDPHVLLGVGQGCEVPPADIWSGSPPLSFYILVWEGLGTREDACIVYAPRGYISCADGSRRASIYVAASSACLQESTIRYYCTASVIPPSTLWLWRRLRHGVHTLSIIRMELGDIHRELRGPSGWGVLPQISLGSGT